MSNTTLPRIAYSTIADGNMSVTWGPEDEVVGNRKRFLEKHRLRLEDTVILDLKHDDAVAVVGRKDAGTYVRTEVALTREHGLVLMMFTADCSPTTFYDPVRGVIGLGHMSWDTTDLYLACKAIAHMQREFGTDPADVLVTIGPSVRKESYRQAEVRQKDSEAWAPFLFKMENGETAIDVVGFNTKQLTDSGVRPEHISVDPTDTITSPNYFSHYRSVRTGEKEGRFATIAVLE